jgi:hypothetical protein
LDVLSIGVRASRAAKRFIPAPQVRRNILTFARNAVARQAQSAEKKCRPAWFPNY